MRKKKPSRHERAFVMVTVQRLALSQADVSEALGIEEATIAGLVRAGRLPPARKLGSKKFWLPSEVSEYLKLEAGVSDALRWQSS
jgi:predicted DNA-binding transcriptional regulator AlpA